LQQPFDQFQRPLVFDGAVAIHDGETDQPDEQDVAAHELPVLDERVGYGLGEVVANIVQQVEGG